MISFKNFSLIFLIFFHIQSFSQSSFDARSPGNYESYLASPDLVDAFYELNHQKLFWYTPAETSLPLRLQLKDIIENSDKKGLDKNRYHLQEFPGIVNINYPVNDSLE